MVDLGQGLGPHYFVKKKKKIAEGRNDSRAPPPPPPPPLAQSLDPPLEVKWFGISLFVYLIDIQ